MSLRHGEIFFHGLKSICCQEFQKIIQLLLRQDYNYSFHVYDYIL